MTISDSSTRSGFFALEFIVALIIFTGTAIIIASSFWCIAKTKRESIVRQNALSCATNILENIIVHKENHSQFKDYREFDVLVQKSPISLHNGEPTQDVTQVSVTVSWKSVSQETSQLTLVGAYESTRVE